MFLCFFLKQCQMFGICSSGEPNINNCWLRIHVQSEHQSARGIYHRLKNSRLGRRRLCHRCGGEQERCKFFDRHRDERPERRRKLRLALEEGVLQREMRYSPHWPLVLIGVALVVTPIIFWVYPRLPMGVNDDSNLLQRAHHFISHILDSPDPVEQRRRRISAPFLLVFGCVFLFMALTDPASR